MLLSTLADVRDIVIIITGSIAVILLLVRLGVAVVIGVGARMLFRTLNRLAKDEAIPIVHDMKETTSRVRGTTTFIGETTISPIIRTYSLVAGTRRALEVLTGLSPRKPQEGPTPQREGD